MEDAAKFKRALFGTFMEVGPSRRRPDSVIRKPVMQSCDCGSS